MKKNQKSFNGKEGERERENWRDLDLSEIDKIKLNVFLSACYTCI